MYTTGPNNSFWLTAATGMDVNGYDMMNDCNFALFRTMGGVVGPHGGKMKIWGFAKHSVFGEKTHRLRLPAEQ